MIAITALLCLLLAAVSSVLVTGGIVGILIYESAPFFARVSLWEFLTDTYWTPQFDAPRFGILPLVAGTLVTTLVALAVATASPNSSASAVA